jgi:hypothetical protein
VVFLAGHADVLENQRFVLLLPSYPFQPPAADPAPRPGNKPEARKPAPPSGTTLHYSTLYFNLMRLGALRRLVVIDACRAEAIGNDPGVKMIQRMIDAGARHARTAYLCGTRRGELAKEDAALKHGLITYALLKGMGESALEPASGCTVFDEMPNADCDHNRIVTTAELRQFLMATVPALATEGRLLVQRQAGDGPSALPRAAANRAEEPEIQASSATFSLLELPAASSPPRAETPRAAGPDGAN